MKKSLISIVFIAAFAAAAMAQTSQLPFADPFVLLDDGVYYSYGTRSANGIEVYSSTDLKTWKHGGLALSKNNTNETQWFWAPEVYHLGDKYYMYYSANEHLYVALADSPKGPFIQHGPMMMWNTLASEKCIDSSVFFDDDGKAWMFFVRFNDGNCIWQVQLEDDYATPIPSTLKKCINVTDAWENIWPRVTEGPNVVKHNGVYYLTYSANSYESQDYAVGYATATSINGPWTKYSGNPILKRYGGLVGTGHHTLFRDKEDNLKIAFHAHNSTTSIHPRRTYIADMEFSSDGVLSVVDGTMIVPKSDYPNGGNDQITSLSVDWNVTYLPSARSGVQYDIKYTKTNPTATDDWKKLEFDDSKWTASRGPIGNTGFGVYQGTAPLGTSFSDVNDGIYNVWFRRTFELDEDISDRDIWLACGHDDEGAIYLDGVPLIVWGNEWNYIHYFKLSPEQAALLTKGKHVLAVWAKNNTGGFYYDVGFYGKTGDTPTTLPTAEATADMASWAEFPLEKKIGVYQTPLTMKPWLDRDLPKLGELDTRSMRYEIAWGKDSYYGQPAVTGTAEAPEYDFEGLDYFFDNLKPHCSSMIFSHGYSPTIINPGDWQMPPTNYDTWGEINKTFAAHWKEKGYDNRYIEVWNEPDLTNIFFKGTIDDYLKIYEYASKAIREADNDVKIGGPAGAGTGWHSKLVSNAKSKGWPLDFISGHAYGNPTGQLDAMRTALRTLGKKDAEMLMTEYAPYTTGANTAKDGPVERAEAAMTFFNALPTFMSYTDLDYVTWAQYIDAADVSTGKTLEAGHGDKMGLIDGDTGKRKALFNAFKLFGWMPIDRCNISTSSTLQGLASKTDKYVAVVLWNPGDTRQGVNLKIDNIPFSSGIMEVYRIDKTRNSYYETKDDDLTPDKINAFEAKDGCMTVDGIVEGRGVFFVRLMAEADAEALPANGFAKVKNIKKYRTGHANNAAYAIFDDKTWTARLSSNELNTARTMVGVIADELPDNMQVTTVTSDEMSNNNSQAMLAMRIDYLSTSGEYTKSVLIHGDIYHDGVTLYPEWGTKAAPDVIIEVDDFSNFKFSIKDNAPDDFSGQAAITFIMSRTGAHSKAIFTLKKTDQTDGIDAIENDTNVKSGNSSYYYNLQGQRILKPVKGLYIRNGKKYIQK